MKIFLTTFPIKKDKSKLLNKLRVLHSQFELKSLQGAAFWHQIRFQDSKNIFLGVLDCQEVTLRKTKSLESGLTTSATYLSGLKSPTLAAKKLVILDFMVKNLNFGTLKCLY